MQKIGESHTDFEGAITVGTRGLKDLQVGTIYHDADDVFIVVREGGVLTPLSIKSLIPKTAKPNEFTPLTIHQKAHGAFPIPVIMAVDPTTAILDDKFGAGEGSIGLVRPPQVMTFSNRQIIQQQINMISLRATQYHHLGMIDNLLRMLATIREASDGTLPIDPHTGVQITTARRQEVYDACVAEHLRIHKLLVPGIDEDDVHV